MKVNELRKLSDKDLTKKIQESKKELLKGKVTAGGILKISMDNDELTITNG